MDTKECYKCKEKKDIKNFGKDKSRKDGLSRWCKGCKKEYRENNKDKIKEKKKEYYKKNKDKLKEKYKERYKNNKDKIKEYYKEYYEENKDKLKEKYKERYKNNKDKIKEKKKEYHENNKDKFKEYKDSPWPYNSIAKTRKEIELYEEVKESIDGYLMCRCTYCNEWFKPSRSSLQHRLGAINGTGSGEKRLYCSDNCKRDCPSFWQQKYFKDQKLATSREVQPELRQMVFERDNWTCQKCNIYKDDLNVGIHCHHIEGIQWEPLESADIDICITYCADCHKEVHKIEGCTYQDLQCA